MKYIIFLFLSLFLITGCTQKSIEISVEKTEKEKKPKEEKSVDKLDEDTLKEETVSEEILMQDAFKIAVVFPSKIVGKYAKDTTNTVLSYLLHNNIKFEFEVFDSQTQDLENIKNSFAQLRQEEFKNVIVLYTQESLENLFSIENIEDLNIYLPLVNKYESNYQFDNVVYGGIDYKKQIQKLLELSNKRNSVFYFNNSLGERLKNYVENSNQMTSVITMIDKRDNEYKRIVKNNKLNNSTLFLNTPIIKSSILLSQLRAYESTPYLILSTQLNYTPLVISLTQYEDRNNFVIANSISDIDFKLQESLHLLDVDVSYNWVNYSTLIGIDSIFSGNESKYFSNKLNNNQVEYEIQLYKSTRHGFKKFHRN